MQKPRPGLDEEDDTAFGGLAPRSGPAGGKVAQPRRAGTRKWAAIAIAAVVVLLILLYVTGRL
jgi:hypothetical protein